MSQLTSPPGQDEGSVEKDISFSDSSTPLAEDQRRELRQVIKSLRVRYLGGRTAEGKHSGKQSPRLIFPGDTGEEQDSNNGVEGNEKNSGYTGRYYPVW